MRQTSTGPLLWRRAIAVSRFDDAVYEEIEHDPAATREAAIVVVTTSLLAAIGAGVEGGLLTLLIVAVAGLIGWAAYAFVTYFIGTRLLAGPNTQADWGEVARTLGYASAPRALLVLTLLPAIAGVVVLIVGVWVLATTVVALRAALDFSTGRAIATAVLGWLIQAVLFALAVAA